jgi:AcrR family transcriptional regulator
MARPQAPRGQGRGRVLEAALEQFAEHGVSGTSLQMIADHLGVTKAAVYYQFRAKDDIVVAMLVPALEAIRDLVGRAEQAPPAERRERVLDGLVDLVVDQRQVLASLYRDPEVERVLKQHGELSDLVARLGELLVGPRPSAHRRVAMSVLGAGLANAGVDPALVDLDDAVLRRELRRVGRALLPL